MKTKIINLAIAFLILGLTPLVLAEGNQLFFSINLDYDSGTISQQSVKLIESMGEIDKKSLVGDYKLKIYSFNEELLYESNFDFDLELFNSPPKEWFDDEGNQIYIPDETEAEPTLIERTTKVLFAPYSATAKELRIEKENKIELIIDVSEFALCNQNNICDNGESKELCSEDCSGANVSYKKVSFWQGIINWIKSLFS